MGHDVIIKNIYIKKKLLYSLHMSNYFAVEVTSSDVM